MATINVNSTSLSVLGTAIQDASGGDQIVVAGGPYTGIVNLTSGTSKASELIIRGSNPNSPPVINGRLQIQGQARNLTFRRLNFVGTEYDTGSNGVRYPTASEPLRFDDNRGGIKLFACLFDFYLNGLKFQRCESGGAEVAYCNFERMCVDPLMVYGVMPGFYFHHNSVIKQLTDPARRNVSTRHPDATHIRPNEGQVGTNPMANMRIEYNLLDDPSGYLKGFFCNNEKNTVGVGFTDPIFFNNDIRLGRYAGIELTGGTNSLIERNRLRPYDAGVDENPSIEIELAVSTGIIRNNVTARAIVYKGGALASNFTVTGNSVSSTASPTGFVEMVDGTNCGIGAYVDDGGAVTPDAPSQEWSNPPTNTASKDGRVGTYYEIAGTPTRYGAVLIVPSASLAWDVVSALPTTPGTDVSATLFWRPDGGTSDKRVRVGDPATNASGSRRFDLIGAASDAVTAYSVLAGESMSGIKWGYKRASIASPLATYTGGFTAPPAPPVEDVDPLAADQWEFVGSVYEVSPGRFTKALRIIPIVGPAYTGLQWDKSDGVWRSLIAVGTDGGATTYQLEPSEPGGVEHTVQYAQTLNIRLRYAVSQVYSPASLTTKGFTGPNAPDPIDPYEPGDLLTLGGQFATLAGVPVSIPTSLNRPDMPVDLYMERVGDTVTIAMSPVLPGGADRQGILYAGEIHWPVGDVVTFTAVSGKRFCLAMAWGPTGTPSIAQHIFI